MRQLLLVMIAGALGTAVRYLTVNWAEKALGTSFPWGVFAVNVVGSFLIAVIAVLAVTKATLVSPATRITIATGFLGGLTTYSAFNQDTLSMIEKKQYAAALGYVLATLIVCLIAGMLGMVVARKVG